MGDRSLSRAWPASWAGGVSGALAATAGEFEHRHDFPAGANEARPAGRADQSAAGALAQAGLISADLVTFRVEDDQRRRLRVPSAERCVGMPSSSRTNQAALLWWTSLKKAAACEPLWLILPSPASPAT